MSAMIIAVIAVVAILIIFIIYKRYEKFKSKVVKDASDAISGVTKAVVKATDAATTNKLSVVQPPGAPSALPPMMSSAVLQSMGQSFCSQHGTADQKQSCNGVVNGCVPYVENLLKEKALVAKMAKYGQSMSPTNLMSKSDAYKVMDDLSKVKGFNTCVDSISKLDPKYVYDIIKKSGKGPKCVPAELLTEKLNFSDVPTSLKKLEGPVKSFINLYPKCTMESISA